MSSIRILGMGNPLLDISATVSDMTLCDKYGLKMGNACLAGLEHASLYSDIVSAFGDKVQYIAGGATQNSIRVAQWVSGSAGCTAYIGCVGNDAYGKTLAKCAEEDGVKPLYQVVEGKSTGTCAVLVHDTERTLCANLAAAEALSATFPESEAVAAAIQSASIIYNAGFPLTHEGGAAIAAALGKHCAENGKIYATNLSAPFICQFFKDRLSTVLLHADFVFGNESEAAAWAEANGCPGATVEEVAKRIAMLPKASGLRPRTVIITQGAKQTVWVSGSEQVCTEEVTPVEKVIDVNGAGDAFVGGFLAALDRGASLRAAVKTGHWAAGHIITRSGCTFDRSVKAPHFE